MRVVPDDRSVRMDIIDTGIGIRAEDLNAIWEDCIARSGGPFLFGARPTIADAMFAPVVTRYITYDVAIEGACRTFADAVLGWDAMVDWMRDALAEPEEIEELDIEF